MRKNRESQSLGKYGWKTSNKMPSAQKLEQKIEKRQYEAIGSVSPGKKPTFRANKDQLQIIQLKKANSKYPSFWDQLPTLNLSTSNWVLYDHSNQNIFGVGVTEQREVASLTKIMTVFAAINLTIKYQLSKKIMVRISSVSSAQIGTSAQLPFGKWVKLSDLFYGAMLPSGNDAAYLIAQVFGLLLFYEKIKSEKQSYEQIESINVCEYQSTVPFVNRFLKEMNRIAKELKMFESSFGNPHGLANILNTSSARDILILSREAWKNEAFQEAASTQRFQAQLYDEDLQPLELIRWENTNRLLLEDWEGIKTGQTVPAGNCLAAKKGPLYLVVLNCHNLQARFEETKQLFDLYYNTCK